MSTTRLARPSVPLVAALFMVSLGCLTGCGATVAIEDDGEASAGRIEQPLWAYQQGEAGGLARVCIPMGESCLRLVVPINSQDRIDTDEATGELVGHGCDPASVPESRVETFHGTAFTGHGTLWLDGDASLSDGSSHELAIEAQTGDCP